MNTVRLKEWSTVPRTPPPPVCEATRASNDPLKTCYQFVRPRGRKAFSAPRTEPRSRPNPPSQRPFLPSTPLGKGRLTLNFSRTSASTTFPRVISRSFAGFPNLVLDQQVGTRLLCSPVDSPGMFYLVFSVYRDVLLFPRAVFEGLVPYWYGDCTESLWGFGEKVHAFSVHGPTWSENPKGKFLSSSFYCSFSYGKWTKKTTGIYKYSTSMSQDGMMPQFSFADTCHARTLDLPRCRVQCPPPLDPP